MEWHLCDVWFQHKSNMWFTIPSSNGLMMRWEWIVDVEVWMAVLDMWNNRHVFWVGLCVMIAWGTWMKNEEGKGDDGFDESVSLNKSNNELNELYVFLWLM